MYYTYILRCADKTLYTGITVESQPPAEPEVYEILFIKNFVESFCRARYKIKPVLGHFDLSHDHILIDKNGAIPGIIDFGDICISDPAHEFNGFWDYDPALPREIHKLYRGPKDPLFLQRCKEHFIHRWIYLLYDGLIRRKNMKL